MRISDWSSDVCSSDLSTVRLMVRVKQVRENVCQARLKELHYLAQGTWLVAPFSAAPVVPFVGSAIRPSGISKAKASLLHLVRCPDRVVWSGDRKSVV